MDRESTRLEGASIGSVAHLETPVLFLIFNRPATTREVFETIRAARPRRLYVAADGPRPDVTGEPERCAEARKIATAIDWPCQLQTRFQGANLGLEVHVSSALDWFFADEEEGIVLEDDCVGDPSFFRFCSELLEYYRNAPAIMHISGNNFQYGRRRGQGSYYFSKYPFVWGWATWRRAWRFYNSAPGRPAVQAPTWDAQWLQALADNHGVSIVPNQNLVSNVGFGEDATHTKTIERFSMLPHRPIDFPLRHPYRIHVDRAADKFAYYVHFRNVRHASVIWLYELGDFAYRLLKSLKRALIRSLFFTKPA